MNKIEKLSLILLNLEKESNFYESGSFLSNILTEIEIEQLTKIEKQRKLTLDGNLDKIIPKINAYYSCPVVKGFLKSSKSLQNLYQVLREKNLEYEINGNKIYLF